jgi:hypothetical protein
MKKTAGKKGCDHYECGNCGYQTSVRAEELDYALTNALSWMFDVYERFGIIDIPCTKASQQRLYPDKLIRLPPVILESRVHPKLKYWLFVEETKRRGVWRLNSRLAREFLEGGKTMCKYVYVCEDVPTGQSYETVTRRSIEEAAQAG